MLAPILVPLLNNCFEIMNSLFDFKCLNNSTIESEKVKLFSKIKFSFFTIYQFKIQHPKSNIIYAKISLILFTTSVLINGNP